MNKLLSYRLILASQSPRRRELLQDAGIRFDILPADADETEIPGEPAKQMVERLALAKAEKIALAHPAAWVLAADTTVVVDEKILGKPLDHIDAARMLGLIQGREHEVWGGISLINNQSGFSKTETHCTKVKMRKLSSAEIKAYIETGEPMDKAGSYAIQGVGASLVESVNGSYTNVVGLNLSATLALLRLAGILTDGK